MKIRTGFVSNSSSSSFIVYTGNMSREQIKQLDDTLEEIRLEMNKENDVDEDGMLAFECLFGDFDPEEYRDDFEDGYDEVDDE